MNAFPVVAAFAPSLAAYSTGARARVRKPAVARNTRACPLIGVCCECELTRRFDMVAPAHPVRFYSALASCVLIVHALFIVWVVFGALVARSRPILRWLHVASLIWGILTEILPWPCPLTVLEDWLEQRAGIAPYQGGFLLSCLDQLVYPAISPAALTTAAVLICALNLAFYIRQIWIAR
jgi:Protein of Unknown function (DUF2784)